MLGLRVLVGLALLAGFLWFVAMSLPPKPATTAANPPDAFPPRTMRLDTPLPGCDGDEAVNGVLGLLRGGPWGAATGLSNIQQVGGTRSGDHTCWAVVDTTAGARPLAFTITRPSPGARTWQLTVAAR